VALAGSGVAAAFALAACCAVPLFLATLGISANWLVPLVSATTPYTELLTGFAVVALAASVFIVLRAKRTCQPGDLCARPAFRWSVIVAAAIGAVLLVLSKIYA
jgi:mercuric ion transport protein